MTRFKFTFNFCCCCCFRRKGPKRIMMTLTDYKVSFEINKYLLFHVDHYLYVSHQVNPKSLSSKTVILQVRSFRFMSSICKNKQEGRIRKQNSIVIDIIKRIILLLNESVEQGTTHTGSRKLGITIKSVGLEETKKR